LGIFLNKSAGKRHWQSPENSPENRSWRTGSSSRVQRVMGRGSEGFWATGLRGSTGLRRKSTGTAGNRHWNRRRRPTGRVLHDRVSLCSIWVTGRMGYGSSLSGLWLLGSSEILGFGFVVDDPWRIGLPWFTGPPVLPLSESSSLSRSLFLSISLSALNPPL
jgi:hypothetical protein